jgi:transcriptional regulator of heat shock response
MKKRNNWINDVNHDRDDYHKHQEENRKQFAELRKDLAKNNEITLAIFIENKREAIIAFAGKVADPTALVTHEQFRRIFKIYEEYEAIIKECNMTNGEVDISIRIIREAYEDRLKNRSFVEDVRGYNG